MNRALTFAILILSPAAFALPTFTQSPVFTFNPATDSGVVSFAVSETTDVEVSIIQPKDSSVVRHLAAGLLGNRAPAPLTAGALAQTIPWDGRDDFGDPVANAESLTVRVRAGMRPELRGFAVSCLAVSVVFVIETLALNIGNNIGVWYRGMCYFEGFLALANAEDEGGPIHLAIRHGVYFTKALADRA